MKITTRNVARRFAGAAILATMLVLGVSCGGADHDGGPTLTGDDVPHDFVPVPDGGGTPGGSAGGGGTTGGGGSTDDGGGTDDGSGDGTGGGGGTGDGSGGGGGGSDVALPVAPAPSPQWDGFDDAVAVAFDPLERVVYALAHTEGTVWKKHLDADEIEQVGFVSVSPPLPRGAGVRGAAFNAGTNELLAVLDLGPGQTDYLVRIDTVSLEVTRRGPIEDAREAYAGVESLAWYAPHAALYAVDAERKVLLRINAETGAVELARALTGEVGFVAGLTADPERRCLYASDPQRGAILRIEPPNLVPPIRPPRDVELMGKTTDGQLDGIAFVASAQEFFAVDASQRKLLRTDPMGTRIDARSILGMTFREENAMLYGTHADNGMLVGIQPGSGWKHYVGYTGVPRLEGLADGPGETVLYAVSPAARMLYRIEHADGSAAPVGIVEGVGGPWNAIKSLARVGDALYAVDEATGDVLRIDPLSAAAQQVGTLGFAGVQSLAYRAEDGLLHAYSDAAHAWLRLRPETPSIPVATGAMPFAAIGALAWEPIGERLLGTDLSLNRIAVVWETPRPNVLPYDGLHALTQELVDGRLIAFDVYERMLLAIDESGTTATELALVPGPVIEALAADTMHHRGYYASDVSGPYIGLLTPDGNLDYIKTPRGDPVPMPSHGIKALAFDPRHEVLYGVDLEGAGGATLVTIDLETGNVIAFANPIGYDSVEAMTWDPVMNRLLAFDRESRTLLQIEAIAPEWLPRQPPAWPGGLGLRLRDPLPEEYGDVRAMAADPALGGTVKLLDATLKRLVTLDSITGDVIR
jgi:hypothetical protein